jgi:hypothetical protein
MQELRGTLSDHKAVFEYAAVLENLWGTSSFPKFSNINVPCFPLYVVKILVFELHG